MHYTLRRNGQCNLVLKDESNDRPPYSMDSFDHLKTRTFDELWEWAITPRFSLDRSVKDRCKTASMAKYDISQKLGSNLSI